MYLYKCDKCGRIQKDSGEKFYNLTELKRGDRGLTRDLCEKCVEIIIKEKQV